MFKEFKLPEGVSFTDEEKRGITALGGWMTEQFNEFQKSQKSEEDIIKGMKEKLAEVGLSPEKIEAIEKGLKQQGLALAELKQGGIGAAFDMPAFQKAFEAKYDELAKALKVGQAGYTIKADESSADKIITRTSSATGPYVIESVKEDPNIYLKRRDRQYIHDITDYSVVAEVPETLVYTEEGDDTGVIAVVEENGLKPQVGLKLIKNSVNQKKAAGYIVVTEEMMKFRTRAWAQIRRLFSDKVYRDYENILTDEMLALASSYISTPLDGTFTNPDDFHAIVASITQLESLNFAPNVLVLHPSDKWRLALATTANGMFVLPYIQQGGTFSLLGLNVITTTKMTPGEFIIGESGTWKVEEEAPQIRTGLVNDDFIHNRQTIVGEIFFISYVPSNLRGSFIKAKFADIKEALAKA